MKDGGPAFPRIAYFPDGDYINEPGMSLRDWFAGMAMQGLCGSPVEIQQAIIEAGGGAKAGVIPYSKAAYELADAMLKEREK